MNKTFWAKFFAVFLILSGVCVGVYASFIASANVDKNLVFSNRTLLSGLWDNYKKVYWEKKTGRTLDKQQNNITTSEGQSYTMLRAVWQSDRATFDKSWSWTKENLDRPDDALFAWRWGEKSDGTYGILRDEGGQNTASDADSDIALALAMAGTKWQHQPYITEARAIIRDIYKLEVVTVAGVPYLTANNLEKNSQNDAIINPSYFAPYAYRVFAKLDTSNDWGALVTSSYDIINKSMEMKLDKNTSAGIVPNWISLDKETGEIAAAENEMLNTDYGFDAIRTPFRLALDYQWNNEPRAKETLTNMSFLGKQWQKNNKLFAIYAHDGTVVANYEVAEMYATSLGYFMMTDPATAAVVYDTKLKPLYNQNKNSWTNEMTYYGDNWTWFGIALYDNKLDNITKDLR